MKKKLIYSLSCPFTKEVHYIGKTTEGMVRPLSHLKESHSDKIKEWVSELKDLGYAPEVNIVQNVSLEEDLDKIERYWIAYHITKGCMLLNTNLVIPITILPNLDEMLSDDINEMSQISTFIKEKRKSVNLTQQEFADKAGVALTVVRKIEQGKSNVNLDGLLQMLKMFGTTIEIKKKKK